MTRHEPPRLAVAILNRVLADDEPLAGDLLEAAAGRSRAWLWRQLLHALVRRAIAGARQHTRATAEGVLVGAAMSVLLGFYALVAASLLVRVLGLGSSGTLSPAVDGSRWNPAVPAMLFAASIIVGLTIGRLHERHRAAAVIVFGASATAAAFLNLLLSVTRSALQAGVVPPDAALHILSSTIFIAGLLIGTSVGAARAARSAAVAIVLAALVLAPDAGAQTTAGGRFEVASITRNMSTELQGSGLSAPQPGGRYIARGVTLQRLVTDAYGDLEVVGGPPWASRDRFDVDARGAGEPALDDIRGMLRTLLADRFSLRVHTEPRESAVFFLDVDRGDRRPGPGLRQTDAGCAEAAARYVPSAGAVAAAPPCGDFRMSANGLVARGMRLEQLAQRLSGRVGRQVIDRSGLPGAYDIELQWSSDSGLAPVPRDSAGLDELRADGVTLFTALQEQLGLRLSAGRAPVPVLVIDNAAPPTGN